MTSTHPTAEQLDRYRRRIAPPSEVLAVDAHVATCERCWSVVRSEVNPDIALPVAHLTYDEMEAYVDGRADADDRAIAAEHLAQCAQCRGEVEDLERVRESMQVEERRSRFSARALLAAAAILVIVAFGAWMFFANRDRGDTTPSAPLEASTPPAQPATPAPATPRRAPEGVHAHVLRKPAILDTLVRREGVLRGESAATFALLEPVGAVVLDDRPRFFWEAAPDATRYDVAVADVESGSVAVSGSSDSTRWLADEPLPRGRTYSWQVTAHTAAGTAVVAPGSSAPEALFHVAERAEPLPEDPLERGVELANRGVLHDAERSLQQAAERGQERAEELLEEVRSWRTSSHGLPTTTNGAQ